MKLIVGLGNIGARYENTHHNMGFMVVDQLCEQLSVQLTQNNKWANYFEGMIAGEKVCIIKPATYMNLSGNAILYFMQKFKFKLKDIIIIYDDIDLPLGTVRVRKSGSGGTHNGMRDIVARLGSEDVLRIRVGIGNPGEDLRHFVLKKIKPGDKQVLEKGIYQAAQMIIDDLVHKNRLENVTV